MIITALLLALHLVIKTVLLPITLLADVQSNASIVSAVVVASGYISSLNAIFPMASILIMLGLMFSFEVGYMFYKIVRWLYQKIPMIN